MPDTSFSWANLKEHVRKYLWVYVVGVVVSLFATNLLWTTTRPRPTSEQSVIVYLASSYVDCTKLDGIAQDMLARTQPEDENLRQVEFQNLQYSGQDYTSSMLLMTRLSAGEGDAFLAGPEAMDALVLSQALEPLDEYVADGWLSEYCLEPYYATLEDEDTGERQTFLAGLRLDTVDALAQMQALDNEGAFLCLTVNGGNLETTMKALEIMMEDLTDAATEATEPAA